MSMQLTHQLDEMTLGSYVYKQEMSTDRFLAKLLDNKSGQEIVLSFDRKTKMLATASQSIEFPARQLMNFRFFDKATGKISDGEQCSVNYKDHKGDWVSCRSLRDTGYKDGELTEEIFHFDGHVYSEQPAGESYFEFFDTNSFMVCLKQSIEKADELYHDNKAFVELKDQLFGYLNVNIAQDQPCCG